MATTVTLAQYAMESKQPLVKGAILGIAQEGVVADIVNWRGTNGRLSETGLRYDGVNEPDWIPLDGTISTKSQTGRPLSYSVHQMAMHIDIPAPLEEFNTDQVERQSTRQTMLSIKGAAYKLNDQFINGDQASDANGFEGINKLVATLGASQTVGSAEIDLTGSFTAALAESLWVRLDQLFHAVEGHIPDAVFCNSTTLLKIRSMARQNGMLGDHYNWFESKFDVNDPRRSLRTAATRPAMIFQGVPFYDLGLKADQSTQVIGNAYAEGGSSGATRLFAVKFGPEDLEGLQAAPINVKKIGLLEDKEVIRHRLTGMFGLALWGPRSVAKAVGIKVA